MCAVSAGILVVGAGLAGVTYARLLAEAGFTVQVTDRRDHVAGNAFDAVDDNGVRVHRYGPHLFHTNVTEVFDWLGRFTAWVPYRHRVRAALPDGRTVPLPVNLDTINAVFDARLTDAAGAAAFLRRIAVPIAAPRNAGEYLRAHIGDILTDLFFRPYTRKMWGLELEDMHASVVQRLPIRLDRVGEYFPADRHQALPADGYTAMVERMLDHPAIRVALGIAYAPGMERGYRFCFNSMAIDEFFDGAFGALPYRSIRFHHRTLDTWDGRAIAVTNATDAGPFTREIWWHCLPGHLLAERDRRSATNEEPCDYRENGFERYYPVRTADDSHRALYRRYQARAAGLAGMRFIGRCGTYQYLDMDQVVNQSLAGARRWLGEQA